ncbi:hypothetical protein [Actinophytocola sediminis]
MWTTTAWVFRTWLKVTVALAVLVGVVALVWGVGSRPFDIALVAAVVLDLLTVRGLLREWTFDARGHWWWFW